jgi:hypothetical protein
MKYTNTTGIPLSLAVWMAADNYDHSNNPNEISATGLLKSLRQIILSSRVTGSNKNLDISNNIPSSFGTAVHDSINYAWEKNHTQALTDLGYPEHVIKNIKINPDPKNLEQDHIPIYMEQRVYKQLGKYTISGKYDFVSNGVVEDFKTTGVYTYIKQNKNEDYILQGSIYRWLNPDIITADYMHIQFIFTDWSKLRATTDKNKGYPQSRILEHKLELKSLNTIENWIRNKLDLVSKYTNTPESEIPLCNKKELWQDDSVYKYYKNPSKRDRSTANFDNFYDANIRLVADGNCGVVVEIPGKVKACAWCNAFELCSQKDNLIRDGLLII